MTKIKHNIIANFIGKGWNVIMSLTFIPIYIKFIGIEAYGLVGFFVTLQAVFVLLDFGLSTTLNREMARLSALPGKAQEMRDLVRTLEIIYWGVAILIGLVIIGLSSPIANYWLKSNKLSISTVRQSIMIAGGIISFRWMFGFYSGGLLGLQRQVLLNVIDIIMISIRCIGTALVLWKISPTIQAFFCCQIIISLIHTLLVKESLWKCLPGTGRSSHFQKKRLINIWRFAAGMTGISVLSVILVQIDKVILSKLLTLEIFGYYILAGTVATSLYYFITPIYNAVFPSFSQLVGLKDQAALKQLYHKSCQFISVLILPPTLVIVFFSQEIMLLWTGNPTIVANTHYLVSLLIIGTALNGIMYLPYALQLSHGWTKLTFYANLTAIIIRIPIIIFFTKYYGPIGAAFSWIILNACYVLICIPIMHSRLLKGEQWKWYFKDVGVPLFTAFIIVLFCRFFSPDEMSKYIMVLYLGFVSGMTLLLTAFFTPSTRLLITQVLVKFKVSINKIRNPINFINKK